MEVRVSGVPVHFAEYGSGMPVVALHGAGVDHREVAAALEPILGTSPNYRRLYPDLPGMGRTPAPASIRGNDDVLDLLLGFVDNTIGDRPFLVMGHSYGAYLARGIAALKPEQAIGLALVCPVGAHTRDVPPHHVLVERAGLPAGLDAEPRQRTATTLSSRPLKPFACSRNGWLHQPHSLTKRPSLASSRTGSSGTGRKRQPLTHIRY